MALNVELVEKIIKDELENNSSDYYSEAPEVSDIMEHYIDKTPDYDEDKEHNELYGIIEKALERLWEETELYACDDCGAEVPEDELYGGICECCQEREHYAIERSFC